MFWKNELSESSSHIIFFTVFLVFFANFDSVWGKTYLSIQKAFEEECIFCFMVRVIHVLRVYCLAQILNHEKILTCKNCFF